ncbi:TonB-dependent receptor domain-containing protein [Granulicella rosea]|nr:TonB-dependent receptor [Granulicella rosea]
MRLFPLPALFAVLTTTTVLAQVDNGIITGVVKDSSGAAIDKAQVTLRNTATGLTTTTSTNGSGIYVSPPLSPAEYDIRVEAPGFKGELEHVKLDVGQRVTENATLTIGAASDTVEVEGTTQQLNTESATISDVRTEQQVHDLPLNGRNFAELLGLSAGVIPASPQATTVTISESRQQADFSTNGLGSTDNRFLFDGIADNQNHSGNGAIIFPPIDALEEFREENVDADARYGRTDAGTVNVIYKSGTSHYHGEVFDFLRNSVLDAKNYFDTGAKPGFRLNTFGGTFGGPLWPSAHPRTFFFADYNGQRESQGLTYVNTVPKWGPQGVGDFSLYSTKVVDPQTGVQFPGNVIPLSYISGSGAYLPTGGSALQGQFASQGYNSQVAQNVFGLYTNYGVTATPNLPGTANGTANNYLYNPSRIDNSNAFDVKVNRQFSDADSGFVRFSYELDNIVQPGNLPNPLEGGSTFGFEHEPAYQTVFSETHVFSPRLLNTLHFGWSRLFITTKNFDAPLNLPTALGIPGIIVPDDLLHTNGLPIFQLSGGTSTIGDPSNVPDQLGTNNYEETDSVTLTRGKHSLEFGTDIYRMQYNVYMDNDEHGLYSFTGNYTAATVNGSKVAGLGLADLLIGAPASGIYSHEAGTRGARQLDLGFYAQDNYKVSNRLTLNLGLRYDNFLGWPWTEVRNRMYQFLPSLSTTQVFQVGTNGIPRSGANGSNTNFQPRIGFAYSLTPKTVVHAGYGIYFGAPSVIDTATLLQNAPAIDYYSFTNPGFGASGFTWLSNGFVHATATDPANLPKGSPLNALDPNSRNPYTEQYHASVQQQIGSASTVTVSYVGNVARNQLGTYAINQPTPGTSATTLQARRPYTYFGNISQQRSSQYSNYNSLQITADRRTKTLNFQFSYTYSHALSAGVNQNYYNPAPDYGNSAYDIPNRFVGSVTYALPFQGSGWYRPAVRGWQLNAILSYSDGLPFSVSAGSNTLYNGTTSRANLLPGNGNGSLPSNQRSVTQWFNTAAFANPGAQQWGNSGPNILQGPGTKNVDFSVFKNIKLTESRGVLQLRSEFFNLFNTPQFNNPNSTVGGGFGTITSAGSPVTLQRISREIQLAAKVTF